MMSPPVLSLTVVEVGTTDADDIMKLGADRAHEPKVCSRFMELGRNGVIAATMDVDDADDDEEELNEELDGETIIDDEQEEGEVEVVDETLVGMSIV